MKKLSKLTESIWSDIQDRSSGETVRKEDDIDLLNIKELCEYLKTIYKTDSDNDIRILEIEDDNHQIDLYLVICLYQDEEGYYRFIYYNGDYINTQLDVIETLNCRFEFERKFSTIHSTNDFDVVCIDIYPKDRARVPITNKFFIEVLDFILDRINTPLEQKIEKITESIWSDLQDRSSGEVLRKEDDVDLMDMDEFYEYTQEKYNDAKFYIDIHYHDFISVDEIPVYGRAKQLLLVFDWTEPESKQITLPYSFRDNFENVFNKLTEKFSLEYPEAKDDDEYDDFTHNEFIYIHPKDDKKITNRFYIEVLDYIIKAANGNLTESIWSDIQDRSTGETTRKEDDINHMDIYEFWEYLHDTYISQHPNRDTIDYPTDDAISMPFFMKSDLMMYMLWIEFNDFNNHKIECISLPDVTVSKYDGIEDVFNLEGYSGDETRICVCPKDGSKITNSFAVKVIDYLLDQAVDDKYRMFIKKERS